MRPRLPSRKRVVTTQEQRLVKRYNNSERDNAMIPRIVKLGVVSECHYRILEIADEIKKDKNFKLGSGSVDDRRTFHATNRFVEAEEGQVPKNQDIYTKWKRARLQCHQSTYGRP
ncbi:hypothetical protein PG984_014129 [Apiospora sp. TS-2023a]